MAPTPAAPIPVVISVLVLLTAVSPLSIDMYLPGCPAMATEFGVHASSVQLTLTTFLIGVAAGQRIIGALSDQFGRRRLLLSGTVVGVIASAACALAPSIELRAAFRFAQGFTGADGIGLSRAIISDRARGARAPRAVNVMMIINGVAPIPAPLLGGALIGHVGRRGVVAAGATAWTRHPQHQPRLSAKAKAGAVLDVLISPGRPSRTPQPLSDTPTEFVEYGQEYRNRRLR